MTLQARQPLRYGGVKSTWLDSLPDSGTEMLTISSTGVVSRQAIPSASFGALTGLPSDNAALQSALDAKANTSSLANYLPLAGGTMTGRLTLIAGGNSYGPEAIRFGATNRGFTAGSGSTDPIYVITSNGQTAEFSNSALKLASNRTIDWSGNSDNTGTASQARIAMNAYGQIDTRGDLGFRVRNLANTAASNLSAAEITSTVGDGIAFAISGGGRIAGVGGGVRMALGHQNGYSMMLHQDFNMYLSSATGICWGDTADPRLLTATTLGLFREASNVLGQRNGADAQTLRIYGTYTDASNYRRLYLSSTTGGQFTLGVEGAGTGASGNTLRVANSITMPNDYSGITTGAFGGLSLRGNSRTWNLVGAYPEGLVISGSTNLNNYHLAHFMMPNEGVSGAGFNLASSVGLGWYNGDPNTTNSNQVDGRIIRNGTGQLDVRADNGFRVRNLANSADASLTAGAITASGEIRGAGRITSGVAPGLGSGFYITSNGVDVGSIFAGDGAMVFRGLEGNGNRYRAASHNFQNSDGSAWASIGALNGTFFGTGSFSGLLTATGGVSVANNLTAADSTTGLRFGDAFSGDRMRLISNFATISGGFSQLRLEPTVSLAWASNVTTNSVDTRLTRGGTGMLDYYGNSGIRLFNYAGSDWSNLQAGRLSSRVYDTVTTDQSGLDLYNGANKPNINCGIMFRPGPPAHYVAHIQALHNSTWNTLEGNSLNFRVARNTGTTTVSTATLHSIMNMTAEGVTITPYSAASGVTVSSAANVGIGQSNPNVGLVIHRSGTDLPSLRLEDGDITVPFTGLAINPSLNANTVGGWSAAASASGGCAFNGFTNNTAEAYPLGFAGYHGSIAPTKPAINFSASKSDGGTGSANLASNELIAGFFNGSPAGSPVVTIAANGTIAASQLTVPRYNGTIEFWPSTTNIDATMRLISSFPAFIMRGSLFDDWTANPSGAIGFSSGHVATNLGSALRAGGSNAMNLQVSHGGAYGTLRAGTIDHPSGTLTLGNATHGITTLGTLTHGFQTLVADPTTVDIATGLSRMVKNSTSGDLRIWANDGGSMKSVLLS